MIQSDKSHWLNRSSLWRSKRRKVRRRAKNWLAGEPLESRILLATVSSESPVANSHAASTSTDVMATFDERITNATNDTFVVTSRQGGITQGTLTISGTDVRLDPAPDFFPGDMVEVTVTSGIQGAFRLP